MTSNEVRQVVLMQIGQDGKRSNAHGVTFDRCLVTPHREVFSSPLDPADLSDLWVVLEEQPQTCSGYKIVFDEAAGEFGLAIAEAPTNRNVFLGIYGSFLETVDAM